MGNARQARYVPGPDALVAWREELDSGEPPPRYRVGDGFDAVRVAPGLVTLMGGAPGAGKTALIGQLTTDALRLDPGLRLLHVNVEMSPSALMDRQLARISGVDPGTVRGRVFDDERRERIETAGPVLDDVFGRTAFVRPPFDLTNIAAAFDEFEADILVLDYLQRIHPPGTHGDARTAVSATMDFLRKIADAGVAVVAVAAVARGRGDRGSSYEHLGLASFLESSAIEYGADEAFILTGKAGGADRVLKHVKSRNGEARDIPLRFAGAHQSFRPADAADVANSVGVKVDLDSIPGLTERFAAAQLKAGHEPQQEGNLPMTPTTVRA